VGGLCGRGWVGGGGGVAGSDLWRCVVMWHCGAVWRCGAVAAFRSGRPIREVRVRRLLEYLREAGSRAFTGQVEVYWSS
jgi:hypothetical protein